MHKFKKQSLIDWSCEFAGKNFAWITKTGSKKYSVTFNGYEPVEGFETLKQAKSYITAFKWA